MGATNRLRLILERGRNAHNQKELAGIRPILLVLLWTEESFDTRRLPYHCVKGVPGTCVLICFFYSVVIRTPANIVADTQGEGRGK